MAMEVAQHNWKETADQETVEESLIGRRARRNATSDAGDGAVNKGELSSTSSSSDDEEEAKNKKSKNNVFYFDKNGGVENLAANLKTVDFENVLNNVVSDAVTEKAKGIVSGVCLLPSLGHDSQDETGKAKGSELVCSVCLPPSTGHDSQDEAEKGFVGGVCLPPSLAHDSQSSATVRKGKEVKRVVEEVEEVVQLEFFDRAVNKLRTHDAYCPNCSSRITKVILRRVRREETITTMEDHPDLVGCLSCFSIFVHIGKNLKPFPIFGSGDGTTKTAREPHLSNANSVPSGERGKPDTNQEGCFDLHWFFRKKEEQNASEQKPAGNIADPSSEVTDGQTPTEPRNDLDQASNSKGPTHSGSIFDFGGEGSFIPGAKPAKEPSNESQDNGIVGKPEGNDCRINIGQEVPGASSPIENPVNPQGPVIPVEVRDSKSMEIVKSIVYGGLIESITSLGVVSSAAASDASTMNIVTIGVANLIAGFFVICQNLMNLKYNIGGSSNLNDHADRYRELLGQRKHFLLHAAFALLSYLVFGLVPPVVYGFTFRETDDKDYKLIAVAGASLLCVIILSIAKAYTQGSNTFSKYFTAVLSYATAAGMASGIGYATGHLFKRVMDQLGWFDSKPAPSLFLSETNSHNPAWASY